MNKLYDKWVSLVAGSCDEGGLQGLLKGELYHPISIERSVGIGGYYGFLVIYLKNVFSVDDIYDNVASIYIELQFSFLKMH